MVLRSAENQGLFPLVDLPHEYLDTLFFPFLDFDDLIKVGFHVALSTFNLAFDELVIGGINIFVEGGRNLLHLKRRQETVVNPFLERIDIDRLAEIVVGVHVVFALGRSSETELYCWGKVLQNAAPIAFIVGSATMTLVYDDEVEEIRRILAEIG